LNFSKSAVGKRRRKKEEREEGEEGEEVEEEGEGRKRRKRRTKKKNKSSTPTKIFPLTIRKYSDFSKWMISQSSIPKMLFVKNTISP